MGIHLDQLLLSRWQFGLTTLYHFLFVPLTLSLSLLCAVFQTIWLRSGSWTYLRLTRFIGKIFLINFAMGVVTGIVQEFQFGMNWSEYSAFVGDVFGAPLALEGLLAFFFEATCIGIWIFGWDKISRRAHLASIWAVTVASAMSGYFIIAANSFMQHPVGFAIDPVTGRAYLTDIVAVLTNPVAVATFPHVYAASLLMAGAVLSAIACWHFLRQREELLMRVLYLWGAMVTVVGFGVTAVSGDRLGIVMEKTQPMKMAAAEAVYTTVSGKNASFSLFTIGTPDGSHEKFSIRIPYLLSLLSKHSLHGTVEGIDNLEQQYQQLYGPGSYHPVIWMTYWTFRYMILFGSVSLMIALVGLVLARRRSVLPRWFLRSTIWTSLFPLFGILMGWIFTETGRQPWIVFGLMKTRGAQSPSVGGGEILFSLIMFTVVYGVLAYIEFSLVLKTIKAGPPIFDPHTIGEPSKRLPSHHTRKNRTDQDTNNEDQASALPENEEFGEKATSVTTTIDSRDLALTGSVY